MSPRKTAHAFRRPRHRTLGCEMLERRALLAADFSQFIDPNPAPGNRFGDRVLALSTGNVVITSPFDDAGGTDAGAVYLFNGANGALISTLIGLTGGENLGMGGVLALTNGNFLVFNPTWNNSRGAVTWGSGVTGISGVPTALNSLVGSTANDQVGSRFAAALPNGNYVVVSPLWDNGAVADAGAVTWANGATGLTGVVSAANSLVGSTSNDQVGDGSITLLTNGNYVVSSRQWDNGAAVDAGAATFGRGATGVSGEVSASNSLVGSTTGDTIGFSFVTALTNGNYVVTSPTWDNGALSNVGAVTWGSGTTGITGVVSAANSLVGSTANDGIGTYPTAALTNGNYVVNSLDWDNGATADVGAVTWGNGSTGIVGPVSAANSLIGSTAGDGIGWGFTTPLTNGNYVVASYYWDNGGVVDAGAITWGDGTTGIVGPVSIANSLVGSTADDEVGIGGAGGGVTALSNGNYVVRSAQWDNGAAVDVGAATWGDGTGGITGAVSASNSLVGSAAGNKVGLDIRGLANGNYVVGSYLWDEEGVAADVGAATWGNGTTGTIGVVSSANSLVGSTANDRVGEVVIPLANGNYVVSSRMWDDGTMLDVGAATWGSGTGGITGTITAANSLIGDTAGDQVGFAASLPNGNYVVVSRFWDNGAVVDAGAVTWGNGATGIHGLVSPANSLVGTRDGDQIGSGFVTAFTNSNYVVTSPNWDRGTLVDAGAVTFGNGTRGITGQVTAINSIVGQAANTGLQLFTLKDDVNRTYFGRFLEEAGGIVRVGSQIDGINRPPVIADFGGNRTYTENGPAISITNTADVSDADSPNFAGGKLQVQFVSGGVPSDRFAIRNQGTGPGKINLQGNQVRFGDLVIGTFTGGIGTTPLVVSLNGRATPARVQALLRAITFRNASDNPPAIARTVRVFLTDGDGEAVGRTKQITIERVNDAPVLAPAAGRTVGYARGNAAVGLLTNAIVSDPDSPNFGGGRLVVRITQGFDPSNRLLIFGFTLVGNNVQFDGETIGTKNTDGGVGLTRLEIALNSNATLAIVQRLTRNIRFRTAGASPVAQRVIEFTLLDGDGGTSNSVDVTVNVS